MCSVFWTTSTRHLKVHTHMLELLVFDNVFWTVSCALRLSSSTNPFNIWSTYVILPSSIYEASTLTWACWRAEHFLHLIRRMLVSVQGCYCLRPRVSGGAGSGGIRLPESVVAPKTSPTCFMRQQVSYVIKEHDSQWAPWQHSWCNEMALGIDLQQQVRSWGPDFPYLNSQMGECWQKARDRYYKL